MGYISKYHLIYSWQQYMLDIWKYIYGQHVVQYSICPKLFWLEIQAGPHTLHFEYLFCCFSTEPNG